MNGEGDVNKLRCQYGRMCRSSFAGFLNDDLHANILMFLCLIDILLISLTDSHWDSIVTCGEALRPAENQKSAHCHDLRRWLLFWSDGVLVLVPLVASMVVFRFLRSTYTLFLSPYLIYRMDDFVTNLGPV